MEEYIKILLSNMESTLNQMEELKNQTDEEYLKEFEREERRHRDLYSFEKIEFNN